MNRAHCFTMAKARGLARPRSGWALVCLCALLSACATTDHFPEVPANVTPRSDINSQAMQRAAALTRVALERSEPDIYRIGVNDVVEVAVFEQSNLNVTQRVGQDGTISFPPLGALTLEGMTESEAARHIEDRLRGEYLQDPQVTVTVSEIQARRIGVIGAVPRPGQYSSFGSMYLADLLLEAGGLSTEAADTAMIIRPNADSPAAPAEQIIVSLRDLIDKGNQDWNVLLMPGDLVNVPVAGSVHVTGKGIEAPGTYALRDKDILQIIDEAGGLKWEAKDSVYVVRYDAAQQRQIMQVSYDKLMEEKVIDIELQDDDRIFVERSMPRFVLLRIGTFFKDTFRFVVGGSYDVFSAGSGD